MSDKEAHLQTIRNFCCCPKCRSNLVVKEKLIKCSACHTPFELLEGKIPSLIFVDNEDTMLSISKWNKIYANEEYLNKLEKDYQKTFFEPTINQLTPISEKIRGNKRVFLELGSGSGFIGEHYAKQGWFFIGIDVSPNSLIYLNKRLKERGFDNFLLVHGDIQNMPLKAESVDFSFGGGVIEHFKKTQAVVSELYRITKKNGYCINTVPHLNPGNLVYRSLWGGLPNLPILRQLLEFIHVRIFKGRHMIFGYELQFTKAQLRKYHIKSGFNKNMVWVKRFYTPVQLDKIHHHLIKRGVLYLCRNSEFFNPCLAVLAKKL